MIMINTKIHGYLDWFMGILLIALPFILDFPDGAATYIPIILGACTILLSIMTDYELGMAKVISMKTHLGIDMLAGVLLLASPWLFGFSEEVKWPFVILGIAELGAALMTSKKPLYAKPDKPREGNP